MVFDMAGVEFWWLVGSISGCRAVLALCVTGVKGRHALDVGTVEEVGRQMVAAAAAEWTVIVVSQDGDGVCGCGCGCG